MCRRFSLPILSCVVLGFSVGGATHDVSAEDLFPDKNLESLVRRYVFDKRENEEPLTQSDVANISTIEGKRKGIRDLTGLEHCLSLALLDLEQNEIRDLRPLRDLANLQSLNVSKNQIDTLEPLRSLTGLQYVQLDQNRVKDLRPLAGLQKIRSLYLSHNRVEDLSPLAALTDVWSLYLNDNRLSDLRPWRISSGSVRWICDATRSKTSARYATSRNSGS